MKTVESYNDLSHLDLNAKKIIYKNMHNSLFLQHIKNLLPYGVNVWIDSAGTPNTSNIVFENIKWKGIFNFSDIYYYQDFYSPTLQQSINKYIKPSSVVLYQSEELKYHDQKKLINIMNFLIKSYSAKLFMYIDTAYIDFNKLKYSNFHIIEKVKNNLASHCKVHMFDEFQYVFETDV